MSQLPPMTNFQSMEDFENEQNELEAKKDTNRQTQAPSKQKQNNSNDVGATGAERIAQEEIGNTNWIGKLGEYRAANPTGNEGLKFLDETLGGDQSRRFTCTVFITETSNQFGGIPFSNKKSARKHAAKEAVDWLVGNGFMPADGSVKFPKKVPVSAAIMPADGSVKFPKKVPVSAAIMPAEGSVTLPKIVYVSAATPPPSGSTDAQSALTSYAKQIPELCIRLGFSTPRYEIIPLEAGGPLYDGYADFGAEPRIEGKIGMVTGVFGRKRAREEIARGVLSFLRDIERQRMEEGEEEDRKRQQS